MSYTVTDVPEKERFEARDDEGAIAGVLTYQVTGPIVAYTHTRAEAEGAVDALARAAMDDARAKGRTVVPICPILSDWLTGHPEYEKLVARSTRRIR